MYGNILNLKWCIIFFFYYYFDIIHGRSIQNRVARAAQLPKDVSMSDIINYMQKYGHLEAAKQIDEAGGTQVDQETVVKNSIKHMQKYLGIPETGNADDETKIAVAAPRCGISDVQNIMDPDTGQPYQWEKNQRSLTYAFYEWNPHMEKAQQKMAIRQSFNRWASVSPFKFREVTGIKDITPDILVGFFEGCHDDPDCFDGPYKVLAHGYYPEDGHLHFDLAEHWAYPGTKEAKQGLLDAKYVDLLEIATHEIGHVLGVDHIPNSQALMVAAYRPKNDTDGNYIVKKLHELDIQKIQEIYGPGTGSASRGAPKLPNRKEVSTTEKPK